MAKETVLSAVATEVYEALKNAKAPLTLAEIKEIVPKANSAHLTALANREMVVSEKVEKEVTRVVKTKVNSYFLPTIEDEPELEEETESEEVED